MEGLPSIGEGNITPGESSPLGLLLKFGSLLKLGSPLPCGNTCDVPSTKLIQKIGKETSFHIRIDKGVSRKK